MKQTLINKFKIFLKKMREFGCLCNFPIDNYLNKMLNFYALILLILLFLIKWFDQLWLLNLIDVVYAEKPVKLNGKQFLFFPMELAGNSDFSYRYFKKTFFINSSYHAWVIKETGALPNPDGTFNLTQEEYDKFLLKISKFNTCQMIFAGFSVISIAILINLIKNN